MIRDNSKLEINIKYLKKKNADYELRNSELEAIKGVILGLGFLSLGIQLL